MTFVEKNEGAGNAFENFLPKIQCYATCIADSYIKMIKRSSRSSTIETISFFGSLINAHQQVQKEL